MEKSQVSRGRVGRIHHQKSTRPFAAYFCPSSLGVRYRISLILSLHSKASETPIDVDCDNKQHGGNAEMRWASKYHGAEVIMSMYGPKIRDWGKALT
jgi:hypothetical protein